MASYYNAQAELTKSMRKMNRILFSGKNVNRVIYAMGLGVLLHGFSQSLYFVPGGWRAVKFNIFTGLYDSTYGEGAHLVIPFLESLVKFNIRNNVTEIDTSSGSRDLQTVNIAVRVLYHPDIHNLHHIYRDLGTQYAKTVLPSLINEIIRAVIAQFNASDLLLKRPEVSRRIADQLSERAAHFNIIITDVSITQMSFGKEYTSAIEAKQIAQQMAERAKFHVEQAEQEKLGTILIAQGDAESARLIGKSLKKNPGFLEIRRLEAARQIAKMIGASEDGKYYIDSDALLLNPKVSH